MVGISEKALGHSRWRKILSSIVEGSMPAREGEELRYPTVEFVLHTVADGSTNIATRMAGGMNWGDATRKTQFR